MPTQSAPAPPVPAQANRELFLACRGQARQAIHEMEDRLGRGLARRTLAMCDHAMEHVDGFSPDKANRWAGFVQGMLAAARAGVHDPVYAFPRPQPAPPHPPQPGSWQAVNLHLMDRCRTRARQHVHELECRLGRDLAHRVLYMCTHAMENLDRYSEDQANRWLGFIQGALVAAHAMDIEIERDYTRPLFHALKGPSPSHGVGPGIR